MDIYLPIAGMPLDVLMLLALGLSVGVLSGMFSVGGGFILTPLLIVIGVPPLVAVGTGASQVVATSISGAIAHWRRRNVDFSMGLLLLLGGLAGTASGVRLQSYLKSLGQLDLFTSLTYVVVLTVVGIAMLVEGVAAWRNATRGAAAPPVRKKRSRGWLQKLPFGYRFRRSKIYISILPPIGIGLFVGMLTAIMGAGGGFILIPLMIFVLGMPTRVVLGTSSFQIIFVTAFTTVMQSIVNHNVDVALGMPLMIGGVVGAQFGVRAGDRLRADQLRVFLAVLVLGVGVRMLFDLVVPPAELFSLSPPG